MASRRQKEPEKRRLRRDLREEARERLRAHGLRVTAPRLEVLLCLTARNQALTHSEVVELLAEADIDATTIYRNLVKFSEIGVLDVVSRAGGMARYAVPATDDARHENHPHFLCIECGTVSCLPENVVSQVDAPGKWRAAVRAAHVQLEGQCPDCLGESAQGGSPPDRVAVQPRMNPA